MCPARLHWCLLLLGAAQPGRGHAVRQGACCCCVLRSADLQPGRGVALPQQPDWRCGTWPGVAGQGRRAQAGDAARGPRQGWAVRQGVPRPRADGAAPCARAAAADTARGVGAHSSVPAPRGHCACLRLRLQLSTCPAGCLLTVQVPAIVPGSHQRGEQRLPCSGATWPAPAYELAPALPHRCPFSLPAKPAQYGPGTQAANQCVSAGVQTRSGTKGGEQQDRQPSGPPGCSSQVFTTTDPQQQWRLPGGDAEHWSSSSHQCSSRH
ncbi:hypothetical protein HaLaN_01645 [Haematococcus lacustris]|uniref:Uncharacterized protein n=1 Tax=Haematococcus lacustris TaxID=44745 RepID=A0A699YJ76_HAELA|nr:hypothetical protein HaLaN_01645 [Haematococcus lacustris]